MSCRLEQQEIFETAVQYLQQSHTPIGWLKLHRRSIACFSCLILLSVFATYSYATKSEQCPAPIETKRTVLFS